MLALTTLPILKRLWRQSLIVYFLTGILFITPAFSQINYQDFANVNPGELSLISSASIQGNKIRLINNNGDARAAVWYNTTQYVKSGFVCNFSFQINTPQIGSGAPAGYIPQGGADGFAFLIHTWGTGAIGGYGGNMGYARDVPASDGIPYSLAVEFDTYNNFDKNDPSGNHISIHNAGQYYNNADENGTAIIARANVSPDFNDGAVHKARIDYDGATKIMKVFVDDFTTPKVSATVNFDNIFLSGVEKATVGFTAGAALESSRHEILSWSYSPTYPAVEYAGNSVDADAVGPNPVSTAEYHPGATLPSDFNPTAKTDTAVLPGKPTEIWAKYYYPTNISSLTNLPVVILLHGNHNTCGTGSNPRIDNSTEYTDTGTCPGGKVVAPSHRGYDYLAEKLTSWGYVVASVNANRGITGNVTGYSADSNFPEYPTDLSLIDTRGRLVLRHLQRLSEWNDGVTQFISSPPTFGSFRNNFSGWVGMKITTKDIPVRIKLVGRLYRNGNSQTHPVKIVRVSDNTSVANVSIPMSGWNHDQFKYASLGSVVTLDANTSYYIVSQETSGGDTWYDSPITFNPTSVATIDGKVSSTDSITWNTSGGVANQAFGTVDFMHEGDKAAISSTTLGTARNDLTAWVGMKFTVGTKPLTVRSLGRLFKTGNTKTHTVKIVRVSDNTSMGSVSVSMTGGVNGKFKYASLSSPITLAANTAYYLVSQETSGATEDQWYDSNTTVVSGGDMTINGRVSSPNGTTTWDNSGAVANQTYGPLNLVYEVGTTPTELGVNLKGKLDFNNVGLMGHSRGGEGVRAANSIYEATTNNTWKGTYGRIRTAMNIKGIFEFAPTDGYASTILNAPNKPWSVVLGACDGDLINLDGIKTFDRMYYTPSETSNYPKSTVFVYGANHNFFNTQWQTSEGLAKCTGEANTPLFAAPNAPGITGSGYGSIKQQKTALSTFLAFFRANVGTTTPTLNQVFDPRYKLPDTLSSQTKIDRGYAPTLFSSNVLVLNDLRFSSNPADLDKDLCAAVTTTPAKEVICSSSSGTTMQAFVKTIQNGITGTYQQLAQDHAEDTRVASVTWHSSDAPNRYFQVNAGNGTFVNASTYQTLEFRLSRRRDDDPANVLLPNTKNLTGAGKFTNLSIQLVMNDGKITSPVSLSKYLRLDGPVGLDVVNSTFAPGELHPILQSVRIPLTDFAGGLPLTQIKGVRFIFNDHQSGAIFLSGLRFTK